MFKERVAEMISETGHLCPELIYCDIFQHQKEFHFNYDKLGEVVRKNENAIGTHHDPSYDCSCMVYLYEEEGHKIVLLSGELDRFIGKEEDLLYFHNKYYYEYKF